MRVLYERKNGTLILNLKGHSSSVLTFAIFPNGDYVGGSADTTIKIWNPNDQTLRRTLSGHTSWVSILLF